MLTKRTHSAAYRLAALLLISTSLLLACLDESMAPQDAAAASDGTPPAVQEDSVQVAGAADATPTLALTVGDVLTETVTTTATMPATGTAPVTTVTTTVGDGVADDTTADSTADSTATVVATENGTDENAANTIQLGAILDAAFVETIAMAEIDARSRSFYPSSNFLAAQYPVDIYRVEFQSSNELNEPADAQATLFIPRPEQMVEFPVLAYAPGTTGIGNECPPSQEAVLGRRWGGYRTHMLSYAGQGFIGILPDGQNYDDPDRPHEYFISQIEAHVLLDAIRAAYNFYAEPIADEIQGQPTDFIFIAGYSNGGHAAFAAKDFLEEYAPDLPVRGVISHGATTNVEFLMRENPLFTPYLVYSYNFYYGDEAITPQQVLAARWLPTFEEDALTKCVDELFAYYSSDPQQMYNDAFRAILYNDRLAAEYPVLKTVLDANYAGIFGGFDVPVAFFQGTADYTVTPPSQERFAIMLCQRGQPVTYESLPAIQHVQTRQVSFVDTIEWMRGIIRGETPRNDCGQIGE